MSEKIIGKRLGDRAKGEGAGVSARLYRKLPGHLGRSDKPPSVSAARGPYRAMRHIGKFSTRSSPVQRFTLWRKRPKSRAQKARKQSGFAGCNPAFICESGSPMPVFTLTGTAHGGHKTRQRHPLNARPITMRHPATRIRDLHDCPGHRARRPTRPVFPAAARDRQPVKPFSVVRRMIFGADLGISNPPSFAPDTWGHGSDATAHLTYRSHRPYVRGIAAFLTKQLEIGPLGVYKST